jgi:hypothetical protein
LPEGVYVTTDADRQPAVEAAARLCSLATLGVVDVTLAALLAVGPVLALGILPIVCGVSLALVEWVR